MGVINANAIETGKQWTANTVFTQGDFLFRESGGNYPASSVNANRGVYLEVTGVTGDSESSGSSPFTDTMTPGTEITDGDLTLVVRQSQTASELRAAIDKKVNAIVSPITEGGLVENNPNLRQYSGKYRSRKPQTNGLVRFEDKQKDLLIYESFDSNEGDLSLHAFMVKGPKPDTITAQQAWGNASTVLKNQKLIDGNNQANNVNGSELNGKTSGSGQGWYFLSESVNLNTTNDVSFTVIFLFTEDGGTNLKRATVYRMFFSEGKLSGNPIAYPLESVTSLIGVDLTDYEAYSSIDVKKISDKFNG